MKKYTLISVETVKRGPLLTIAIDNYALLGQGSFGKVYRCYPYHFVNAARRTPALLEKVLVKKSEIIIDETKPLAVKVMSLQQGQTMLDVENEYQLCSAYLMMYYPAAVAKMAYLVMEYVPGFSIGETREQNPDIAKMNFIQRVDAAMQIMLALDNIHRSGARSQSHLHRDLKGENIKIYLEKIPQDSPRPCRGKTIVHAWIMDFGLSTRLDESDEYIVGTPGHMAIETKDIQYYQQTDMYALVPVLLALFDARSPFEPLDELWQQVDQDSGSFLFTAEQIEILCQQGLSLKGLFDAKNSQPPAALAYLKLQIKQFIVAMARLDYRDRPKAIDGVKFFQEIHKAYHAHINNLNYHGKATFFQSQSQSIATSSLRSHAGKNNTMY